MSFVYLAPESGVDGSILDVLEGCLSAMFGLPVRRLAPFAHPSDAYDPRRHQYDSTKILRMLKVRVPADAMRLLGIVDRDIFIPMLTFVFGQAQLNGEVALVSLTRLRQESYGFPPDAGLFLDRACTEAVHELGHTFGLVHCHDVVCAMSLSTSIEQVDAKAASLCTSCQRLLRDSIGHLGQGPRGPADVEEDRR